MSLSLGTRFAGQPARLTAGRFWQSIRSRYARMMRATRLRRELSLMDERMLSDIGVSRAQLGYELDKWEAGGR
jgi:uncharacterized protein YjiS (DUF1127 family)